MAIYFKDLGNYGRMGNSLFQSACTIALAKRNNDSYFFPSNFKYRDFFHYPEGCFISPANINPSSTYEEPCFHYVPITYKSNLNLHGYFQSDKYFSDFKDDICHILKPRYNAPYKEGVASIHVRRDDYLKYPNHHPVLGMDYYEKAMELVGVNKFLVFSDDIKWCKQHFIGNQFEFSEGQHEVTDLSLQAKCEHNICGNSTFSWWASYLNNNPNKIIIAPQKWFGPALSSHNIKDLFPDSWIKI